jgi:hypothetical protein
MTDTLAFGHFSQEGALVHSKNYNKKKIDGCGKAISQWGIKK